MKSNRILFGLMVSALGIAGLTQSCVSDAPFADGDGEGTLKMHLVVNSNLTRAEGDEDDLNAKCVVYISGTEGLLYKYEGVASMPSQLPMKSGSYVAEAWTGDSVTASFEKRFFRGYEKFNIQSGQTTPLILTCKIANVVVSINPETVNPELMKDWKITVSNSRGFLEFNDANVSALGYFMMPKSDIALGEDGNPLKGSDGWTLFTNLEYKIEGTTAAGEPFEKTGLIGGNLGDGLVEHAHNYQLNLEYNPDYEATGGSFITITVDSSEVKVEDTVSLYSKPAIKGVGFDLDRRINGTSGNFEEHIVKVAGFGGLDEVVIESEDFLELGMSSDGYDLMHITESAKEILNEKGIEWDYTYNPENKDKPAVSYIHFKESFLNNIPDRESSYKFDIVVKDNYGKTNTGTLRIGVGAAPEDPIVINDVNASGNLLDIRATDAVIRGQVIDAEAGDLKVAYRPFGSTESWTTVDVPAVGNGATYSVTLTGLNPSTKYAYKAMAGEFSTEELSFTTESVYVIPNAGMETWSTYGSKNLPFPGEGSVSTFWDTGNKGAATVGTKILTSGSNEMIHNGNLAARLETQSIIGQIAAGNLFIGEFKEVAGLGAKLDFGRPYEGSSHPKALTVWANYRAKTFSKKTTHFNQGDYDQAQIFIAFATQAAPINTSSKQYFNPDEDYILGYGEVTWTKEFGPEGKLEQVSIPITWREKAKTTKPTHIIIVCSASKYGDYLEGAEGSLMYLDDFELVY